jgi:hypothetical protein
MARRCSGVNRTDRYSIPDYSRSPCIINHVGRYIDLLDQRTITIIGATVLQRTIRVPLLFSRTRRMNTSLTTRVALMTLKRTRSWFAQKWASYILHPSPQPVDTPSAYRRWCTGSLDGSIEPHRFGIWGDTDTSACH